MFKILLIMSLALSVMADTFKVQSSSSSIKFSVVKFFFLDIKGQFTKFEGKITLNKNTIVSIYGKVDATSADMGDKNRDEDLKEEGYLNSTKFQYIDFQAQAISDKELEAIISIKGVTKVVLFNIEKLDIADSRLTLKISSILSREDFKLNGSLSSFTSNDIDIHAILVAYLE